MTAGPYAVSITLLGHFSVTIGDRTVGDDAPWGSRKAQHLVKLLALAPGHQLAIDQLLDALWPDLEPAAARRIFYQTLYLARRALDPEKRGLLAVRQGGTVTDYEAALALYPGDILPNDRYEDWSLVPRDGAGRQHSASLLDLAALHAREHAWDAACARLEQLLARDPANEEAHVALMRAHAAAGRRARALAQYRLLREALRAELDTEPEPESQRLYAALLSQQDAPVAALPTPDASSPHPNLPSATTTFFGREGAIDAVGAALREARLVTLTGAGGCGKTRLGLAVAHTLLASYVDGVWWVDLAALAEATLVPSTIAQVLGLREQSEAALIAALRDRTTLLVLDNCEHLLAACAPLISTLLAACAALHILATSREALRVAGEAVWRVPSLPVPEDHPATDAAALAALRASPAVQLFVARARLAQQDFALTTENAPALATICRRLDGIPLALELAAARVAVLTPTQLAARLDDALRLLSGGLRTALPRHRTLRATLDWSYQFLNAAERALLARLAVFAGGWTLDAAEAVCPDAGAVGGTGDVLDGLAALVEQSLVQVEVPTGDTAVRYRVLETVRQYAAEQLATIEGAGAVRERHAAFYLALAEEGATHYRTLAFRTWDRRLTDDLANLRAALHWWLDRGEAEAGLRLANALYWYWYWHTLFQEGWGWQKRLLALPGAAVAAAVRARALASAALLIFYQGEYSTTRALATEALDLCATAGIDDPAIQIQALIALGHAALGREDFAQAQAHYEEALTPARRSGRPTLIGGVLVNLTNTLVYRKDLPQAVLYGEEALGHTRASGDIPNLCYILGELGNIHAKLERVARAAAMQHEALRLSREFDNWYQVYQGLGRMVDLALQEGRPKLVAQFWGGFCAIEQRESFSDLAFFRRTVSAKADQAREHLGAAVFAQAEAVGHSWSNDEAVTQALVFLETLQAPANGTPAPMPTTPGA